MTEQTKCHCGKPMHLSASQKLMLKMMGSRWGKFKKVIMKNKIYSVPTYYIVVHGLKGSELPNLGFKEEAYHGE